MYDKRKALQQNCHGTHDNKNVTQKSCNKFSQSAWTLYIISRGSVFDKIEEEEEEEDEVEGDAESFKTDIEVDERLSLKVHSIHNTKTTNMW